MDDDMLYNDLPDESYEGPVFNIVAVDAIHGALPGALATLKIDAVNFPEHPNLSYEEGCPIKVHGSILVYEDRQYLRVVHVQPDMTQPAVCLVSVYPERKEYPVEIRAFKKLMYVSPQPKAKTNKVTVIQSGDYTINFHHSTALDDLMKPDFNGPPPVLVIPNNFGFIPLYESLSMFNEVKNKPIPLFEYEIWIGPWAATGQPDNPPVLSGKEYGRNFQDACMRHFMKEWLKMAEEYDSKHEYYDTKRFDYNPHSNKYWGCSLFDNEKEAMECYDKFRGISKK